jgi:hypothetical protein
MCASLGWTQYLYQAIRDYCADGINNRQDDWNDLGHGIVIKNGSHGRGLIAHELAHVMQYERFGGIDVFLKEYIKEVAFPPGYPHGPLEREAAQIADRICRNP